MKKIIAISFLLATFMPAAHAEEHSENYVGVSVSKLTASSSSTGAAVVVGHRYNEYLAGEIAFEDSGAVSSAPEKTTALSVAAIGFVPLYGEFEGFVRLGYASAHSKDAAGLTATHGDITYGVGVEYHLNDKYSVDLGWNHLRVGNDVEIPRANENSYVLTVLRSF
jgi:opacity protein-like surface antigen